MCISVILRQRLLVYRVSQSEKWDHSFRPYLIHWFWSQLFNRRCIWNPNISVWCHTKCHNNRINNEFKWPTKVTTVVSKVCAAVLISLYSLCRLHGTACKFLSVALFNRIQNVDRLSTFRMAMCVCIRKH